MDALQSQSLTKYLLCHKLISDRQFGFLPGRSTTLQLVSLVNEWQAALDSGSPTVAVFMDFMKAFDRVWHNGLLHKLALAGLSDHSVAWLTSYLSARSIEVTIGNTRSTQKVITACVPQGSHLGPVLFLVFINDMPDTISSATVSKTKTDLYADDALLHTICPPTLAGRSPSHLQVLQTAVDTAEEWAVSWGGRFGHSKTIQLAFGHKMHNVCQNNPLYIEQQRITLALNHKHLGIILSSTLRWSDHIAAITLKASQRIGLLCVMAKTLQQDLIVQLYTTYVRPCMEYASPVWHSSLSAAEATTLERLQARMARTVLRAPWETPKSTLLTTLDWPSLRFRRAIACMVLFHRLMQLKLQPSDPPVPDLLPFITISSASDRHHRKPRQIVLPRIRSQAYLRSYFVQAAIAWNSLPSSLQETTSPDAFRHGLEERWNKSKFVTNADPLTTESLR